jgi:hypothetical protein
MRVLTLCKKSSAAAGGRYKKVIGAENHNAPPPHCCCCYAEEATILSHLLLKITLRKLLPLCSGVVAMSACSSRRHFETSAAAQIPVAAQNKTPARTHTPARRCNNFCTIATSNYSSLDRIYETFDIEPGNRTTDALKI